MSNGLMTNGLFAEIEMFVDGIPVFLVTTC